jgi:hypothetical protein
MTIDTDITTNNLPAVVKMNTEIFKIMLSDYRVQIASIGVSKWSSSLGVDYYLSIEAMTKN